VGKSSERVGGMKMGGERVVDKIGVGGRNRGGIIGSGEMR
jgi:hypothetical protein